MRFKPRLRCSEFGETINWVWLSSTVFFNLFSFFLFYSCWGTHLKSFSFQSLCVLLSTVQCLKANFVTSWWALSADLLGFIILVISFDFKWDNSVFLIYYRFVLGQSFKLLLRFEVWLVEIGRSRLTFVFRAQNYWKLLIIQFIQLISVLLLACVYSGNFPL